MGQGASQVWRLAERWTARGESKRGPGWPCKRMEEGGQEGLSGHSRLRAGQTRSAEAGVSSVFSCIHPNSQRELDTGSAPGDAGTRPAQGNALTLPF